MPLARTVWSSRVVAGLSEKLLREKIDQTEQELQRYFLPVSASSAEPTERP